MYDVIIIGGGPGGYMAAEKTGKSGLHTLLIEKEHLGGVCLNEGCIPTKTLLNSAKVFHYCAGESQPFGVTCDNPRINHEMVIDRKNRVVSTLVSGVEYQMKNNNVTVINGIGRIVQKINAGFEVEVNGKKFEAKNLIIASGSSAVLPKIEGLEESLKDGFAVTSKEILNEKKLPNKLVIVGAGVIGLEFASYFNTIGIDVTVIEMMDKIAGNTDNELSGDLRKIYKKRGIDFILSAQVTKIKFNEVEYEKKGERKTVECDKVLVCIGRKANINNVGFENIGIQAEKGVIVTDKSCRTNIDGVYAIGDVNGKIMLAHTAYRESECVARQLCGENDEINYDTIPAIIYTNPEIASVGYNEETVVDKYSNVEIIKLPMTYSGRFMAENENTVGFCKVLFDKDTKTMIGANIMANYSSEFIEVCSMLINLKIPMEDMKKLVFPHPTVGEILHDIIQSSTIN